MAKLRKGIFGPISGKLGPVIGATWKKISYLRTPSKVLKIKKTPAQIANIKKFKFLAEWLVPFYPFVNVGFQNHAENKTEINAAFSVNYKQAVLGVYPNLSIDYSKVVLSAGPLSRLQGVEIVSITDHMITLTWTRNDFRRIAAFNDQLMLVLYNEELKIVDGFIGGTTRADLKCEFNFNPKLAGKPFHVYLCMYALNGKMVSDSQYLGKVGGI